MRKWLLALCLLPGLWLFLTCKKDNGEATERDRYDVYTNPSDPALLTIATTNDAFITYHGERDPYYFDKLAVIFPDEHDEYVMFLDMYGRPVQVFTSEGAAYIFLWHDNRRFLLSAISPSGEIQVSVPVHLDSMKVVKNARTGRTVPRSGDPRISLEDMPAPTVKSMPAMPGVHEVTLSKCNAPIQQALVILNTDPVIGRNLYLGQTTGEGTFFVKSPGNQAPVTDHETLCRNVVDGIGQQLSNPFWSGLYNALAPDGEILADILRDEIIAAFPKEPSSKVLLQNCDKAINMLTLAAMIHLVEDPDDIYSNITPVYISTEPLSYTATITVVEPGEDSYTTEPYPFNPNGSSSWDVEIPSNATARARFTEPEDPTPAQDYVAKAFVICADESGTEVNLKIEGSDGYFKEDYLVVYGNTFVTLDIPGGGEGVRDVITINILDKEWKLSIIF